MIRGEGRGWTWIGELKNCRDPMWPCPGSGECSRSGFGEAQHFSGLKAGMASPWPPLFLSRTTLRTTAVCDLARLVRSHMVPRISSLTMRHSPWGTRTRVHWVWHRASILAKSHFPPPLPRFQMPIGRGSARSFFTRLTPKHTRYMRRFIPRNRGRLARRSSSRIGCFLPFPKCQPSAHCAQSTISDVRLSISAPWNQSLTTAQRFLHPPRSIMNGTNGTNGNHVPNGTNGINGATNGTTNGTAAQAFIGAIDQGTTSSRFLIFNQRGEVVVTHQIEFTQIYPQPG